MVAHYEQIVQCGIFGIRFLYLGLHSVAVPATFQYLVHAEAEQFFPLGEPVNRLCIFVYRDYEVIPRVVACCDTGCLDCHIVGLGRSPVHGYVTQHVVGWQYYGLCRRCDRHCPRPGLGTKRTLYVISLYARALFAAASYCTGFTTTLHISRPL